MHFYKRVRTPTRLPARRKEGSSLPVNGPCGRHLTAHALALQRLEQSLHELALYCKAPIVSAFTDCICIYRLYLQSEG
jgi:hypothetical protein